MSKYNTQLSQNETSVGRVLSAVSTKMTGVHAGLVDPELAGKFGIATEAAALSTPELDQIDHAIGDMRQALLSVAKEDETLIGGDKFAKARATRALNVAVEAGALAGVYASGLNRVISKPSNQAIMAGQNETVLYSVPGAAQSHPRIAQENYDDKELENAVKASVVVNYRAARQNPVGEMLFPTVVMSPDDQAYKMYLNQINVIKNTQRSIDGRQARNFARVNLLKAAIDHTILDLSETDIVPAVRTETTWAFVDAATIPHTVVNPHLTTAPLKFGEQISLLGLAPDALLRAGELSQTDMLDAAINLKNLYLKVGNDIIKLSNLEYLTSSNFVPAPQGDSLDMILNFTAQNYPLNKKTTKLDGSALTGDLANIATNEWVVRLRLGVQGNANLQDSNITLNATPVTVAQIVDKDGREVDITAGQGKAIADAIKGGSLLCFDLKARRTNSNKRSRGLILDMSTYSILYAVPLLGPISTQRPLAKGDEANETDLAALITATRTFTSNQAITALFEINKLLGHYADSRVMGSDVDTEYLGISRKLIQPHHEEGKFDVRAVIASLKSSDRPVEVQATLVNKIRDMVFRAWHLSGLGVAADHVFGGEAPKPTVKIATDPVIARYLQVQGDLRTIGGEFDVEIEASWDARMVGHVFFTFGYNTAEGETNYHVLNFGMMLWKPEVVIAAPIYRDGQTSRELTVQPSFLHVCNTPILMHLIVENIEAAAVGKVEINVVNKVTP